MNRILSVVLSAVLSAVLLAALALSLAGCPNAGVSASDRAAALDAAKGFAKGLNQHQVSDANKFATSQFGQQTKFFLGFYKKVDFKVESLEDYDTKKDAMQLVSGSRDRKNVEKAIKDASALAFQGDTVLDGVKWQVAFLVVKEGDKWKIGDARLHQVAGKGAGRTTTTATATGAATTSTSTPQAAVTTTTYRY